MRLFWFLIVFVFAAAPSLAANYSSHRVVTLFTQEPCTKVIQLIDGEDPDVLVVGLKGLVEHLADLGMAWGFILGYDRARGGLHEGEKTTLKRLRAECESAPERTALEILESF